MKDKGIILHRSLSAAFASILSFLSISLSAIDWPAADAAMIRNFGFNDQGRPTLGTVFSGEGPILAAETGEVIFSRSGNETASRLPSPLGAWTVLDHGDGLISVYSRYENVLRFSDGNAVRRTERSDPVAAAGISGWSQQKGFYFILYDRRERRWINPSMIISPFPDTRPPQILAVDLRNAQGEIIPGRNQMRMKQGRYTVLVTANDTRTSPQDSSLAPHRIICSVNGIEIGSLLFETISARDGVLMVNRKGLTPTAKVYDPFPAFEAGEVFLSPGQASLEIIVQDITGNSRSALFRLILE